MKVFLTGGTGFIGSELLKRLLGDNHDIVCLVRDEKRPINDNVVKVIAELNSVKSTDLEECNVVIHAAARAHIMNEKSLLPLDEYRKVNTKGTLALARLAAESRVKRFIFISTIKVNGEGTLPHQKFQPESAVAPKDPYGLSKCEAEQGLLQIAEETGLEVVIIRPPLVYGPGVKGNFASMRKWIKKGIPLPFGSLHNQRSLVALDNLVDFITLCADRELSPKAANQVFLISDGEDVSTSQLLRKVGQAYGLKARLLPIPVGLMKFFARLFGKGAFADRLFGNLQVDSSKARDLLGWKPVTTMDEQLSKMAEVDKESKVG